MSQPNLVIYFDHVLSEEAMEAVSTTLHTVYHHEVSVDEDDDLVIHFSIVREESGSYETTALVWLPPDVEYVKKDFHEDVLGRPYVHRLAIQPKYKQDFINQQVLFRTPDLKFTPFTDPSGKEMLYVEFVDQYVFPDIKWHFSSLCSFIYEQENPKPQIRRGPRFTNLKVEEE